MEWHHHLNGLASLFAAVALSHVVLSPRWREGVVAKFGLVVMILSLLATAALTLLPVRPDWAALWNAGTALRVGIVIVVVGIYLRRFTHPGKPITDWGDLDEASPPTPTKGHA